MSSATFWNRMAKRYSKSLIADQPSYEKKLEITRSYFRPDMELLEIGCGTGSTALLHAPYVKHIHATDISKEMVSIAQSKQIVNSVDNITFEVSAIENLGTADSSKDMILALSVLHLLESKEEVIHKIYNWLKPEGFFVTSTVCLASYSSLARFFMRCLNILRPFGLMPLVKIFSDEDLINCLTDAGFDIEYQWLPGKGKALFVIARKPL